MSRKSYDTSQRPEEVPAEPAKAVGFVASGTDSEALARAILRAKERNYHVFVTYAESVSGETLQFARALDATVIEPGTEFPDKTALRQRLTIAAETRDFPNLLFNADTAKRIDYERSEQRLEADGSLVEVTTEGEIEAADATPAVVVAIPAYNESGTIATVVESALSVADEVLVIDDGSTDDTAEGADVAGATVIEHEENRGYGAALQTAFDEAAARGAEHLVLVDADGQHDARDVPELVRAQSDTGAEVVIGSRFAGDGATDAPLYRRVGLGVVNLLTNLSLGVVRPRSYVRDTQSGFRAFDRSAIESLAASDEIGDRMSASTDILYHAHANDFDIREVGTTITYDVESASSQNPLEHGLVLVRNILYTIERERPMTVLGAPGFLSFLVGFGFAYWTISNLLSTGTFPVGLALVSAIFVLVGLFASFTGILLHALNTQVVHRLERD